MPRRIPLGRIELAAGVAAAVMSLLTLPMMLLAPLFPVCDAVGASGSGCAPGTTRYVSLLATHPEASVWALLLGLLALTLVGAAGAVADARVSDAVGARPTTSAGLLALWGASLAVFAICALGWRGPLGLLYLPSTVALALAAYVALLRRIVARRTATDATDTPPEAS